MNRSSRSEESFEVTERLGAYLRREEKGKKGAISKIEALIGCSNSKAAKIYYGEQATTLPDFLKLLKAYGPTLLTAVKTQDPRLDGRDASAQALIDTACAMQASGLSPQRSGNVSVRSGDGFLITPTGMSYDALMPEDVAYVAMDGSQPDGQRKPSSEWHMHQALFAARPEARAVVHAHSPFAVALACLREDIPPFHYMIAVAGGKDIRCADYATFGTEELARNAVAAMTDRKACLLANHGQLAFGDSLTTALELAREVEDLCAQYWRARQVGNPVILDDAEMDRVIAKFAGYGQQPGEDA